MIALLSFLLGGCAAYYAATWGPTPPDLKVITVGATRETVERTLGEPMRRENNVYAYEYNTRDRGSPGWILLGAILDATMLGGTTLFWPMFRQAKEAQRAEVSIVYGPKDTVIGVSHEAAEAQYREWLHSQNRAESLRPLCLAANGGYAPAQSVQAMRYWYSVWGTDGDRVRGYLWLRLAAFGGRRGASETMAEWATVMTPEEIAEADRLFREWEPEPC